MKTRWFRRGNKIKNQVHVHVHIDMKIYPSYMAKKKTIQSRRYVC